MNKKTILTALVAGSLLAAVACQKKDDKQSVGAITPVQDTKKGSSELETPVDLNKSLSKVSEIEGNLEKNGVRLVETQDVIGKRLVLDEELYNDSFKSQAANTDAIIAELKEIRKEISTILAAKKFEGSATLDESTKLSLISKDEALKQLESVLEEEIHEEATAVLEEEKRKAARDSEDALADQEEQDKAVSEQEIDEVPFNQ